MLKKVKSNKRISASYTENYLNYAVLLIKLFALMVHLADQLLFIEVKMQLISLSNMILGLFNYFKKVIKNDFNKYLIMTEEDEEKV